MVRLLDQVRWPFYGSLEKVRLWLLLELTPAYVAEQGFNQVLHMRNKYYNRLHT